MVAGADIQFSDIFDLDEIQRLQDLFSDASSVASIITHPDGTPITKPSNFSKLCNDIIRKTEKGLANCYKSDTIIGRYSATGPIVQKCLSCGLWDAGAAITVGGKHIANWLIGQVRNEEMNTRQMIQYAVEIGADKDEFIEALDEVPVMSVEHFRKVSDMLFAFANQLSEKAYNNLLLKAQIDERIKAGEALRESELKFRELVENSPDAVAIYSEGKIILVNKECLPLLAAKSAEELIGKPVMQFVHPDYRPLVMERMKYVANQGNVLPLTREKFIRLDGSEVDVEVKAVPIRLENKPAVQLIVRDITAHKKAEETINMLAHAIRSISECVSITDMTDKIIFVNNAFLKTYQYDEYELLGNSINMVRSENNITALLKEILPATKHGGWHGELMNRRKDGSEFPVFVSTTVVHDENNNPLALIGVTTDITERKQVEETLRESEARFRNLLQDVQSVSVQGYGTNGITQYWNQASEHLYGYTAEEAVGRKLTDLIIPPEMREYVEQAIQEMASTGHAIPASELSLMRKDGSRVSVFSHHVIVQLPGKMQELFCIDVDLTERKLAEQEILQLNKDLDHRVRQRTAELEAANKELESFSYSVSHDLKTPLRHINGFTGLFLENNAAVLSEEELEYVQKIRGAATEMEQLIDAILSFSRLNQAELRKTRIHSTEMVQQVIKFFEPDLHNRKITFHLESLPEVEGDEALIRQVWTNLISNAIKYTGKKSEAMVEIGSIPEDQGTTFFVKDNGAGFNMAYAKKLFGVFQRLHKSRDFEGIGIGLANVNRIVSRHGGSCRATGQPEQGATFFFSIPD